MVNGDALERVVFGVGRVRGREAERAERSHAEVDGIVEMTELSIYKTFFGDITIIQYNCGNVFR